MKIKSTVIAMLMGFSAMANAGTVENFAQLDRDTIELQAEQSNASEVCRIEFTDEDLSAPNMIRIGFNKNNNQVSVVGYLVGKIRPLFVMTYDLNKDDAINFSKSIVSVSKDDTSQLDDDSAIQVILEDGTKKLLVEKYNTNEVMFGVGDDMRLTGGYYVDIAGNEELISGCVESAANYLN